MKDYGKICSEEKKLALRLYYLRKKERNFSLTFINIRKINLKFSRVLITQYKS